MTEFAIGQTWLASSGATYKITNIDNRLLTTSRTHTGIAECSDDKIYIFEKETKQGVMIYSECLDGRTYHMNEADKLLWCTSPEEEKQPEAKPVDTALRFDDNKLRFDLIPVEIIIELTRAYTMGAHKYGDNNYRHGMDWGRAIRAVFSHFYKWLSGKEIDEETGCHHLSLSAWNVLTLLYYCINKKGKDTRYKFSIDENFNWVDNHLGIGLSEQQVAELKEKYKHRRKNDERAN